MDSIKRLVVPVLVAVVVTAVIWRVERVRKLVIGS